MTIRTLWLTLLFSVVLLAQQPADPANPFPNHELPPVGWFCHPAQSATDAQTNPKACTCLGMREEPVCSREDEDGQIVDLSNDNNTCKVYCHKESCSCAVLCAES